MNLVIPMAGRGSRFVEAGYTMPKPLIVCNGKTLLEWSMTSLPVDLVDKIIYVCLKEHLDSFSELERLLKKVSGGKTHKIIPIPEVTSGQMITVMKAKEFIDNNDGLIIYNIDTYFKSSTLEYVLRTAAKNGVDGV